MNGGRTGPAPGQDVGNRNKFDSISEAAKTSSQIPQGFKDLIAKGVKEKASFSGKKIIQQVKVCNLKGGGADVPLFETIKTNAGTQPKNELQQ